MAGSWGHMTNDDGTPYDDRYGEGSMLENGGDVIEALEQCYGMVWWLAREVAMCRARSWPVPVGREVIMDEIERAVERSRDGAVIGKMEER